MSEDFKSNFVTSDVDKSLMELEDLNNLVKKKKAEVRKAMFYQKHPDLLQAKKDYEAKVAAESTEKFNQTIKAEPTPEPKQEVKAPEPEPVKATVVPTVVPTKQLQQQVQHNHKPLVVGLNSKWF